MRTKRDDEVFAAISAIYDKGHLSKKDRNVIQGWAQEYGVTSGWSGEECWWRAMDNVADIIAAKDAEEAAADAVTADGFVLKEPFMDSGGNRWTFSNVSGKSTATLSPSVVEHYFEKNEKDVRD